MTDWTEIMNKYIDAHRLAWAPSTLRSEPARLKPVLDWLDKGPDTLWGMIQLKTKPYSRLTLWTRIVNMLDWAIEEGLIDGPNQFKLFRKKNRRLFNHVYIRKHVSITFEEAKRRVNRIEDNRCQSKAKQLLRSGMRFSESFTLQDGEIRGKGSKVRKVFGTDTCKHDQAGVTYSQFYRALKKVDLKPHDLRKVFLTEAVAQGATHFELCKLAGWASINTASSYIGVKDKTLEELVDKINA